MWIQIEFQVMYFQLTYYTLFPVGTNSMDKCGNSKTFTHKIIIEHPPEAVTLTTPLMYGLYSHSPGVTQSGNVCVPGKSISIGTKSFKADFNFTVTSNVCGSQDWDENGCRLETSSGSVIEVLSVKPEYIFSPATKQYMRMSQLVLMSPVLEGQKEQLSATPHLQ